MLKKQPLIKQDLSPLSFFAQLMNVATFLNWLPSNSSCQLQANREGLKSSDSRGDGGVMLLCDWTKGWFWCGSYESLLHSNTWPVSICDTVHFLLCHYLFVSRLHNDTSLVSGPDVVVKCIEVHFEIDCFSLTGILATQNRLHVQKWITFDW